ncbi:MAG: hypothetical protein Dasosvirus1_34 [Dasosvirus sp.]|uniref:Ankyrin repeat protein n=1 Tax=Dasosvirus sp. TaxID=2487764 RepID=A0A3G4ZVE0_9VIRU|nr:MAG: hypothetical protein Dasosvirus1_34 [Dasosvirus sp.]
MDFEEYYKQNVYQIQKGEYLDCFLKWNTKIEHKVYFLACLFDNFDVIQSIITTAKIDINMTDFDNNNGFMMACHINPCLDIIKYLRSTTHNITLKNTKGWTALHNACALNPNIQIIKYLIDECGFDPKEKDNNRDNCFTIACAYNPNYEIVKYFVDEHKLSDSIGFNAENGLISACHYNKNPLVTEYLIKSGQIAINCTNINGKNGFIYAIENKNVPVFEYLVKSSYFLLFGKVKDFMDIKIEISKEQKEIHNLLYKKDKLNIEQKDKLVKFFIDNKLSGLFINRQLTENLGYLGYLRVLKLAKYGIIIDRCQVSCPPEKFLLPYEIQIPNFKEKTRETRIIFSINNTCYYGHRDLLLLGSTTYQNIYSMIDDVDNIHFDLKINDSEIVNIYLRSFYTGSYNEIMNLDTKQLLELCEIVNRLPSKMLTIQKLEYFLIKTFKKEYLETYKQLVDHTELYMLMTKVYRPTNM